MNMKKKCCCTGTFPLDRWRPCDKDPGDDSEDVLIDPLVFDNMPVGKTVIQLSFQWRCYEFIEHDQFGTETNSDDVTYQDDCADVDCPCAQLDITCLQISGWHDAYFDDDVRIDSGGCADAGVLYTTQTLWAGTLGTVDGNCGWNASGGTNYKVFYPGDMNPNQRWSITAFVRRVGDVWELTIHFQNALGGPVSADAVYTKLGTSPVGTYDIDLVQTDAGLLNAACYDISAARPGITLIDCS